MPDVDRTPWNYLLSLERDFIETIDFVELTPDNSRAYSNTFAKLILLTCSEIESVAKLIASRLSGEEAPNLGGCQEIITKGYPGMHTAEVTVSRYHMAFTPWAAWEKAKKAPSWWISYNNVKHDRSANFSEANQETAIEALCGLLILVLYHYDGRQLEPYPTLLECGFPETVVIGGGSRRPPGLDKGREAKG